MGMSLNKLREFVTDMEAWRAVIHGVTKSQTGLNDWTELMGVCMCVYYPQIQNLFPEVE